VFPVEQLPVTAAATFVHLANSRGTAMWDVLLWIGVAIPVGFIVMGIRTAIADVQSRTPLSDVRDQGF